MLRTARAIRITCVLGATALVASGCGGGEAPPAAGAAGTPTPGTATDASTVAGAPIDPNAPVDPNAPAAIDPATGLPVDPTAAAAATPAATVPSLEGDDTSSSSGFKSVEGTPLFVPQAASGDALKSNADDVGVDEVPAETSPVLPAAGGTTPPAAPTEPVKPTKPTKVYTGAKVYVDGMIHAVQKGGTFPKGNPVFRLVSVSASYIEIELIAGEFTAGGGVGTVLDKGDLVSMVNASEQVTYRIKFVTATEGDSAISL